MYTACYLFLQNVCIPHLSVGGKIDVLTALAVGPSSLCCSVPQTTPGRVLRTFLQSSCLFIVLGVSLLLLSPVSFLACRAMWLMIFGVRDFFKAIGNTQL